jgi:SAM-dependent methyltransferase
MAELGASVVAFDFSERFIERAKAHSVEKAGRIEYLVMDATDEGALISLGEGRFDAAVATMALMDMPSIEPLLRVLPRLLRPGGRFVFSVTHPCFNHTGVSRIVEEEVRDGEIVMTYALKIVSYDDGKPKKGIGIMGQPEPHYYFDRTLQGLLGACFRAGMVMDGIEELRVETTNDMEKPFAWSNFPVPNGMVARMRVLGSE